MIAELRTITPEWAAKILQDKNHGNRPMNRTHTEQLAREIKRGAWKVNGDTICLNNDRLIDGQHRLQAVVTAGMSIQSYVIDGLPSDVFDTKDVGKRRSHGDTLGCRGEKNTTRLASALLLVDKYCTGRIEKNVSYSNTEIEELLVKYPTIRESIHLETKMRLISPSVMGACHYLFAQKDPSLADEFVDKITHGRGLDEGSPWYALREKLVANSLSKSKLSREYLMAICIKAWNAARAGKAMYILNFRVSGDNPETFPLVR